MKFRHSLKHFPNENKKDSFFSCIVKEVLAIKLELPCGSFNLWNAYKHSPWLDKVTGIIMALPKLERSCTVPKVISPAWASSCRNIRKTELCYTERSFSPLAQKSASNCKFCLVPEQDNPEVTPLYNDLPVSNTLQLRGFLSQREFSASFMLIFGLKKTTSFIA